MAIELKTINDVFFAVVDRQLPRVMAYREGANWKYISSQDRTVEQMASDVGSIDLVYEATGASQLAFDVVKYLVCFHTITSVVGAGRMWRSGPQLSGRHAPKACFMIGQAFAASQVVLLRRPRAIDSTLRVLWDG